MKLKEACSIALACGLTTTEEAVLNTEMHAISIFTYSTMEAELAALKEEYDNIGNKPIIDIFPELIEEQKDE